MATLEPAIAFEDMEAFLRVAKYTLVKSTDMSTEMKEEVGDALSLSVSLCAPV